MKVKHKIQTSPELESKLTQLRKALKDAAKRFKNLAEITDSNQLVQFYTEKFKERQKFENEIISLLNNFNIRSKSGGTAVGAFSKLHTNLKIIFGKDSDEVSLTKATYHEESLLNEYHFILRKPEIFNEAALKTLRLQAEQIKKDIQHLKNKSD